MSGLEQGAYQTPAGEREKDFYEYLDLVFESLGSHPMVDLREAHEDFLWHIVWKLTGSDPAVFSAARRWLKVHDPAKGRSSGVATVEDASTEKDAGKGEQ